MFQKLIVGQSQSEKPQGTKAEVRRRRIGSIVDAGRQSHEALQPGEARATFETPSQRMLADYLSKLGRQMNKLNVVIVHYA